MHNIHSFHPLAIAINPYFQRINPSSTLHLQLASLHALSFPYIVESIVKKKKKKKNKNSFYDFVVSTNYVHDVNHSRIHTRGSTKKVLFHDDDEIYVGNSKDKRKWKGITLLTLSFCGF